MTTDFRKPYEEIDRAFAARFEKIEKESVVHDWQRHRMFCLKLAGRLGAHSPEEAIEMAEKLSPYILVGRGRR